MKATKNSSLVRFLLRHKYYLLGLLVLSVAVLSTVFLAPKDTTEQPVTPPVVSKTEDLSIVSVSPVGNFESLDVLQPIAVEFNRDISSDGSGVVITASPTIRLKKYVLSSNPKVLWIQPAVVQSKEIQGWLDDVEYTITVGRGSRSADGASLKDSYIFKFRNSPENVYMMAD